MGPNAKELFRLVEDFVDVIGFRMKDLRDAYQVTDNLGKPTSRSSEPPTPVLLLCSSGQGLPASVSSCIYTGSSQSLSRAACLFRCADLRVLGAGV